MYSKIPDSGDRGISASLILIDPSANLTSLRSEPSRMCSVFVELSRFCGIKPEMVGCHPCTHQTMQGRNQLTDQIVVETIRLEFVYSRLKLGSFIQLNLILFVCRKGVASNSILYVECLRWVYKRCSDISGKLNSNTDFHCRRCLEGENSLFQSVLLKKVVTEPNVKLECVGMEASRA